MGGVDPWRPEIGRYVDEQPSNGMAALQTRTPGCVIGGWAGSPTRPKSPIVNEWCGSSKEYEPNVFAEYPGYSEGIRG